MGATPDGSLTGAAHAEQDSPPTVPGYSTIKEGLAYILIPSDAPTSLDPKAPRDGETPLQSVFYNPIQQFNRDLSVLAIKAFGEDLLQTRKIRAQSKPPRGKKRKRLADSNGSHQATTPHVKQPSASEDKSNHADNGHTKGHIGRLDDSQIQRADSSPCLHEEYAEDTRSDDKPLPLAETQAHRQDWNTRFSVLDALSATGLRALRYAQEIPFATSIIANDLSSEATTSIAANVKYNKLEDKIKITTENAMGHMYSYAGRPHGSSKYDVIDLDPYGTAAPFFDAALQAINDEGLLCVTCTDAGVWASCGYPEKSFALYGGTPVKGLHSHEGGLRLILHSIATTAARYGMSIEPLMSLSIDFYARVFVRVFRSPAEVKLLAGKTMLVYNCDSGCGAWETQLLAQNKKFKAKDGITTVYKHSLAQGPNASPFCEHCGTKTHMSGPMYAGPLHNPDFLERILNYLPNLDKTVYTTTGRIEGMVSTALEEVLLNDNSSSKDGADEESDGLSRLIPRTDPSKVDPHPFFFIPSALSKVIHCQAPPEAEVRGALRHAGYNVTRSHARPASVRTNAPWSFIWKLMIEWTRQKYPIREGAIKPETAGWRIMQKYSKKNNLEGPNSDQPPGKTIADQDPVVERQDNGKSNNESIIFDAELGRESHKKRLIRYQHNPRANWGPMNRAKAKPNEKK